MLELQNYVSRFESVRMKLSDLAWKLGFGTFFMENVPFSFTNSKAFATHIIQMINEIQTQQQTPINIYEFGAGMGFLARNILDGLKTNHQTTYKNTQYFITDISNNMIKKMNELNLFKSHKNIAPQIINANKFSLPKRPPPTSHHRGLFP